MYCDEYLLCVESKIKKKEYLLCVPEYLLLYETEAPTKIVVPVLFFESICCALRSWIPLRASAEHSRRSADGKYWSWPLYVGASPHPPPHTPLPRTQISETALKATTSAQLSPGSPLHHVRQLKTSSTQGSCAPPCQHGSSAPPQPLRAGNHLHLRACHFSLSL